MVHLYTHTLKIHPSPIVYRAGKLNSSTDTLSRSPQGEAPTMGVAEEEVRVASVRSQGDSSGLEVTNLLVHPPRHVEGEDFGAEQREDTNVSEIITFLECGALPDDETHARRIVLQRSLFTIENRVLYYLDPKQQHRKRAVVPTHLRERISAEHHSSRMGGHFAERKMYGTLVRHWWWDGMHRDTKRFATNCPECSCHWQREAPSPPTASYSCQSPLPDNWGRHYGAAQD